jgi:hypothetical protein
MKTLQTYIDEFGVYKEKNERRSKAAIYQCMVQPFSSIQQQPQDHVLLLACGRSVGLRLRGRFCVA